MLILITWLRWCWLGFSPKCSFLSLSMLYYLEVTLCRPQLRSEGYVSSPWVGEYLHKRFGILWHKKFFCSHYELMDIYFMLWVIMQYKFYLFAQIFPDLAIGSSFHWLLWPFDIPHHCFVCLFLSISLYSGMTRCPRFICIFPAPASESFISFRIPGFLYWEIRSEIDTACIHCHWYVLASRLSQLTEQEDICVYITLSFCSSQVTAVYFFPLRFIVTFNGTDKEEYA